jgi:hypothetical protein
VPVAVGAAGTSSRGTESGEGRLGIASARTPARSSSTTDSWRGWLDVTGTLVESPAMDGAVETTVPNAAATANVRKNLNCIGRPSWNET